VNRDANHLQSTPFLLRQIAGENPIVDFRMLCLQSKYPCDRLRIEAILIEDNQLDTRRARLDLVLRCDQIINRKNRMSERLQLQAGRRGAWLRVLNNQYIHEFKQEFYL
jgi:hypothetical protein